MKKLILSVVTVVLTLSTLQSQVIDPKSKPGMNLLKVNATSFVLNNYMFQYERVINKTISISVSYRIMPEGPIPMQSFILDQVGDNESAQEAINDLRLSNSAITPEIRFYLSKKGYGRGFYIAPFYRHLNFNFNNVQFKSEEQIPGSAEYFTVDLEGSVSGNTGGILFGAQWNLGRYIALDWWIIGPHVGLGNGTMLGTSNVALPEIIQDELRSYLEDIEIPMYEKTVTVTANSAEMGLKGPLGGIRAGISLGIRF